MAIDQHGNKLTIPNIPDDMPVLVLRADDRLGLAASESYVKSVNFNIGAGRYGVDRRADASTFADKLEGHTEAMARWPGKKELPR